MPDDRARSRARAGCSTTAPAAASARSRGTSPGSVRSARRSTPGAVAHIDIDELDAAGAQRAQQPVLDPWLHALAHLGGAAAEVEHRRQALGREPVERAAQPAGFGFEHRGPDDASAETPPCPIEALGGSAVGIRGHGQIAAGGQRTRDFMQSQRIFGIPGRRDSLAPKLRSCAKENCDDKDRADPPRPCRRHPSRAVPRTCGIWR